MRRAFCVVYRHFGGGGADMLAGGATAGDFCDGGAGVDALLPNSECESTSGVP